jgi:hypothetical protein
MGKHRYRAFKWKMLALAAKTDYGVSKVKAEKIVQDSSFKLYYFSSQA